MDLPLAPKQEQPEEKPKSFLRRWGLPLAAAGAAGLGMYALRRKWGQERGGPILRMVGLDPKAGHGAGLAPGLHVDHPQFGGSVYNYVGVPEAQTHKALTDWSAANPTGRIYDPEGRVKLPASFGGNSDFADGDKLKEGLRWNKLAPGFMPETRAVQRSTPTTPRRAAIELGREMGTGQILKAPDDSQTGASLLTDRDSAVLPSIAKRITRGGYIGASGKEYSHADLTRLSQSDPNAFARLRRQEDLNKVLHLDRYAKGDTLLMQNRLPIDPTSETRVHVVNGEVVPGASSGRGADGSVTSRVNMLLDPALGVIGLRRPAVAQAEDFVRDHMAKLTPEQRLVHAGMLNVDVAPMTTGGHVALETNASRLSGFLHPSGESRLQAAGAAARSHMLMSHLQGYDTRPLAATRAGLAAAGAAGATALAMKGLHHDTDEEEDARRPLGRATAPS